MPRVSQRVNYSTFVGGKISDSNPVNQTPPNVARTLLNVDVDLNGKVGRRLGIEPEDNFNLPTDVNEASSDYLPGLTSSQLQSAGFDFYEWTNVNNVAGLNYIVARVADSVYIYDQSSVALSNSLSRVVDITPFVANSSVTNEAFQAVSIKGVLVCSGENLQPFYIQVNTDTGQWTVEQIDIRIRDFSGVDDALEINERPVSLSNQHQYNLLNQGWVDNDDDFSVPKGWNQFQNFVGKYPSNADIIYIGNEISARGNPDWDARLVTRTDFGNTEAPKGRFIIDPFSGTSRAQVSGVSLTPSDDITERPKAISTFAGRVWYGSVNGTIYYSKVVESVEDLGICHSINDPTAEDINEVLATDGGTLEILDVGVVEKMEPLGNSLLIFGSGGVWAVSGGDVGFTANAQFVENISKVRVSGYRTVVPAEDAVLFWAAEGIYAVGLEAGVNATVQSLSLGRVEKDYLEIPTAAKNYAQGFYDRLQRKVLWSYSFFTSDSATDVRQRYTDVIVYSTTLNAFWDYKFSNEGFTTAADDYPMVPGLFAAPSSATGFVEETVTAEVVETAFGTSIMSSDAYTGGGNVTNVVVVNDELFTLDGQNTSATVQTFNTSTGVREGSNITIPSTITCRGMAYNPSDGLIYIFSTGNPCDVYTINPSTRVAADPGISLPIYPSDATCDDDGNFYILDDDANDGSSSAPIIRIYNSSLVLQNSIDTQGVLDDAHQAIFYRSQDDKFYVEGIGSGVPSQRFSIVSNAIVDLESIPSASVSSVYGWALEEDDNAFWYARALATMVKASLGTNVQEDVTDSSVDVFVRSPTTQFSSAANSTRVALMLPDSSSNYRLTFGQFSSRGFKDWDGLEQADLEENTNYSANFPVSVQLAGEYSSVVESLPQTIEEKSLEKQAPYVYTYFDYLRDGFNSINVSGEFGQQFVPDFISESTQDVTDTSIWTPSPVVGQVPPSAVETTFLGTFPLGGWQFDRNNTSSSGNITLLTVNDYLVNLEVLPVKLFLRLRFQTTGANATHTISCVYAGVTEYFEVVDYSTNPLVELEIDLSTPSSVIFGTTLLIQLGYTNSLVSSINIDYVGLEFPE